jgi:hypothetical protein
MDFRTKDIQYSSKKEATFDSVTRKEVPSWTITKHAQKR